MTFFTAKKHYCLDPASVVTHIAQALDLPGYMKKVKIFHILAGNGDGNKIIRASMMHISASNVWFRHGGTVRIRV